MNSETKQPNITNWEVEIQDAVEALATELTESLGLNDLCDQIATAELKLHGLTDEEIEALDDTSVAYAHFWSVRNEVLQHVVSRAAAHMRFFPKNV
jgi:hypothetical protein